MTNTPDLTVTQEAREQIMRIIGSVCYSERSIPQATDDVIATILSRPEAHAGEVEPVFGAKLFDWIFERFCEGEFEVEINDIVTDLCVSSGFVEKVRFDPESHIDSSGACEEGDDYYQLTEVGHHFINLARSPLKRLAPRDGGEDEVETLAQAMADSVDLDWTAMPDEPDAACGHGMPEGCRRYWRNLAALATLDRGKAQVRDGVLSSDDIFDMGYAWALSLRGQTMEDSRAVGRTLGSQLFEPIRDEIDRAEKEEGFNPFTDADTGIVVAKRIIKQAIRARREGK